MTPYYAALALAAFSVCDVVFLKRAIDDASEHREPDIDGMIRTIEAAERKAAEPAEQRGELDRLPQLAA